MPGPTSLLARLQEYLDGACDQPAIPLLIESRAALTSLLEQIKKFDEDFRSRSEYANIKPLLKAAETLH